MTPADYCRDVARHSGSSFYHALALCPQGRRRLLYALYAFCRSVDDCVDCGYHPDIARQQLAWWYDEIDRAFTGVPQHPIAHEIARANARITLDPQPFRAILDGMAMDLAGKRYVTLADLEIYCSRVAVAVGQVVLQIFGVTASDTVDRFAHHLGTALQLVNVVRDIAEDARMGRIYLPLEWLQTEDVTPDVVLAEQWTPGLRRVNERLLAVATEHFHHADALATTIGRRKLRPALAMSAVYRHHARRLGAHDYQPFARPYTLGKIPKLWITWQAWLRAGIPS
ncbi:MAG: presqualene diphosphate synthase HpnD [Magnetococcales bacterium]|nr:presqualene diphosphate synthase HpnD [Magnetococcales bacterium]